MKFPSLRILVTAGPTREYLDWVRFISNESTGVMGLACAREAHQRGHKVRLIYGPITLSLFTHGEEDWVRGGKIKMIPVVTAVEMLAVLQKEWPRCDALVMAAAVCDFRPQRKIAGKIAKERKRTLTLRLVRNPDILKILSKKKGGRCLMGFALEAQGGVQNAIRKLRQKKIDLIVCNWRQKGKSPFGDQKLTVALLDKEGSQLWLRGVRKPEIAKALVDKIEQICYEKEWKGGKL